GFECYVASADKKTVEINPPPVNDVGIVSGSVCVNQAISGTPKPTQCPNQIFADQPWQVDFTVLNKGNKPLTNWSYFITLFDLNGGATTVLKQQVPGPTVGVNGTMPIKWVAGTADPYPTLPKGSWRVDVMVET